MQCVKLRIFQKYERLNAVIFRSYNYICERRFNLLCEMSCFASFAKSLQSDKDLCLC